MIPTNNEHFDFELYKRVKNSPYEYETTPTLVFKGRPANQYETKQYRILKGVHGNSDSIYIYATNLPEKVDVGDHVKYLGKTWVVMSVGAYYDSSHIINPSCLSDEQIYERCPKGVALQ